MIFERIIFTQENLILYSFWYNKNKIHFFIKKTKRKDEDAKSKSILKHL